MTLHSPDSLHESTSGASLSSAPPGDHEERARVLELKHEAQLRTDRTQTAALLYEAAYLTESVLHRPAHAVQDYLAAYNSDSRSRLPLFALLRMFERRSSYKNLARLYDAELRGARSPYEKTLALIDQATLDLAHGGDPQAAVARLVRALENDVAGEAALVLEANRRAQGDLEGALKALAVRIETCDDRAQRGALLVEAALAREQAGELHSALEMLRRAALERPTQEVFLVSLTRFARQHGFTSDLVEANELRAELIAGELSERLVDDDPDRALIELLRARAVALWYEAARSRIASLADPRGAIECLTKALTTRANDVLLRKTRMLAYDLLEDRESAAAEAEALLAQGAEGEDAAPLHFRLAEHALVSGDGARARESLMEAIATASGSIAADAILDDLLLDEQRHLERIERRESRAATADAERAGRWLLEAAELAANELRDAERSLALFRRSELKLPNQVETARCAYAAGLSTRDVALSRFAIEHLLKLEVDPPEQAALHHHAVDVADTDAEARELLGSVIEAREPHLPLTRIARQRAAEARDYTLLSRSHDVLAELETRDDEALSHLCASARASARGGNLELARTRLEQALTRDPSHPYATALLEEVLRRQGRDEELLSLLQRTQETRESNEDAMLMSGLTAERQGDMARARKLYEDAAQKYTQGASALFCLLQLAARTGDLPLQRQAQQGLAKLARARGEADLECLLAAELLERREGDIEPNELLSSLLANEKLAPHAALALWLGPHADEELRERALDVLEAACQGSDRALVLGSQLDLSLLNEEPHARLLNLCEDILRLAPHDVWASFIRTCVPLPHDEDGHADALLSLAELSSDARFAEVLQSEALWMRRLVRTGEVQGATALSEESPRSVAEINAALCAPLRDAEARSEALAQLAPGSEGDEWLDVTLAMARADLARTDVDGALAKAEEVLGAHPDEPAALEIKRVAARAAGDFAKAVEATEALAAQLDDETALTLLEESAVLRCDELEDRVGAEALLMRVLARAPTRKVAYTRLHDLLRDKEDSKQLVELVHARTEHVHDAEELVRLFYELARLHRARGELDAALNAVDNVLMLDEHVGALALSAEIHTSREEWDEAVEALDAMAGAPGVPKAQRRLCRLGAADFLTHRLDRPVDALVQLESLIADGHDDQDLQQRIAEVALRAERPQRASEALVAAAERAPGEKKAALYLRAARIQRDTLHRSDDAAQLFRNAVAHAPLSREALRELWELTSDPQVLANFEAVVRRAMQRDPLDAERLRDLRLWSELSSQTDASFIALLALSALGEASEDERKLCDAALRSGLPTQLDARVRLEPSDLDGLLSPALDPSYAALLRCVLSAAVDIDHLEPSKFGVGRGQRVHPRDRHPLREEILPLCAVLGLSLDELYLGGNELLRVAALPRDQGVALVLGMGVTAPLSPTRRSQLALQLSGCHLNALPLLTRTTPQAVRLVRAAMAAVDYQPSGQEDLGDLPRTLGRALPRRVKRALPELCEALPDQGAALSDQCELLLRHTRRLALLLSGDLQAGLDDVVGAMPSREAIAGSDDAVDLLRAWTSGPFSILRKKLGLAT